MCKAVDSFLTRESLLMIIFKFLVVLGTGCKLTHVNLIDTPITYFIIFLIEHQ